MCVFLPVALPAPSLQGPKRVVWIIGRQHPGESMASWWMEGFVRRLLDAEVERRCESSRGSTGSGLRV
jgi:murein tripeptide amidase MpaA